MFLVARYTAMLEAMSKRPRISQADHHVQVRKLEAFPSKKGFKRFIDHLVFIAGPMIPLAIAPTAYEVVVQGQQEGINLITWGTLCFTSAVMAAYGYLHKELPLILTYTPLLVLNAAIVIAVAL